MIGDDGIGLAATQKENNEGLGTSIIESLASQLNAVVIRESSGRGTASRERIPLTLDFQGRSRFPASIQAMFIPQCVHLHFAVFSVFTHMNKKFHVSAITTFAALVVVIFVWTALLMVFYVPDSELYVPVSAMSPAPLEASKPARLEIPSLRISADIEDVGINAKREMGTPRDARNVGWYKYGPVPGQIGSAVIDGHLKNGFAFGGVFSNLRDIQLNDDVYIITEAGSRLHFVVTEITLYPYTDAPTDIIFGKKDTARLNLITCAGVWLPGQYTYDQRLVVYTELSDIMKKDGS